jgi:hypothetical protein
LISSFLRKVKYLGLIAIFGFVMLTLQILFAPRASAAQTYNVTTTSACTLADTYASIATNAAVGSCPAPSAPNTVNIGPGTYPLSADLPPIAVNGDLNIIGATGGGTIIDGNGHAGIQASGPTTNNTYNIKNITFQNFTTTASQHVIDIYGNLTIDHIILRNNVCTDAAGPTCTLIAGGENANSNVTISNSSFYNNTASVILDLGYVLNGSTGTVNYNIFNNTISNNNAAPFVFLNFSDTSTVTANIYNNTIANNNYTTDNPAYGAISINPSEAPLTTYLVTVNVKNNILYANTNSTSGDKNCSSSLPDNANFVSQGGNISSDSSCNAFFTNTNDKNSTDAYLGLLTLSNGTYVRPLASNSPAIGNAISTGAPSVDQRGVTRPQNGTYDSGAYEYVFSPTPTPTPTPSNSRTGTLANTGINPGVIILAASAFIALGLIIVAYAFKRKNQKNKSSK